MDGVAGGFALSVSGDDEDYGGSFGELIEIPEVVFFWVAYKGGETEPRFGFLRNTNGIFFEDHQSLF